MDKELHDKGLAVRKEVLGPVYFEHALKRTDDFDRPFQELSNEYCWGAIWAREGLSRHTRSILTLGMMAALGRQGPLKLHIRGALNNGVTREELREVFMQVAVYCGVPAGVEAFNCAREVFIDIDKK